MNHNNLMKLWKAVDETPAERLVMETKADGTISLEFLALELIAGEVEDDLTPPSIAAWLGATYEEVMALFALQPACQPQCSKSELRAASLAGQRLFDAYPADKRKAILLSLLDQAICFDRIDWPKARSLHDIEVAA